MWFASSPLEHLKIGGLTCALAALILFAAIRINRPRQKLAWTFLLNLILSYTLRPRFKNIGLMMALVGWLIFLIVALQRVAEVAAFGCVIVVLLIVRARNAIAASRIGGDEFAVWFANVSQYSASLTCHAIEKYILAS